MNNQINIEKRDRLRKATEILANFGLLILAVGLVCPIINFDKPVWLEIFKWIYAAGALFYTSARIAGSIGKDESFRVRRLRRLEVWAGISFCIASFFWFYNTGKTEMQYLPYMSFKMFQETIIFTLVGALIQIVASWMLASALKKEGK